MVLKPELKVFAVDGNLVSKIKRATKYSLCGAGREEPLEDVEI